MSIIEIQEALARLLVDLPFTRAAAENAMNKGYWAAAKQIQKRTAGLSPDEQRTAGLWLAHELICRFAVSRKDGGAA